MKALSNAARVRQSQQATATAEQILKGFVERIDTPVDDRQFDYRDPITERRFVVLRSEGFDQGDEPVMRYCLQEIQPTGRLVYWNDEGVCTGSNEEPRILKAEKRVGPNGLIEELRRLEIDVDALGATGLGYSVDLIYLSGMVECATEVERCLRENVRYNKYRTPTEQVKIKTERRWAASSFTHQQAEASVIASTWTNEPDLFKGCYTGMHAPLHDETKKDILSYLNAPSYASWVNVRSVLIAGHITLWNAWVKFDPSAPRVGSDKRFPPADVLRQAIRLVAELQRDAVGDKQKTATRSGLKLV